MDPLGDEEEGGKSFRWRGLRGWRFSIAVVVEGEIRGRRWRSNGFRSLFEEVREDLGKHVVREMRERHWREWYKEETGGMEEKTPEEGDAGD